MGNKRSSKWLPLLLLVVFPISGGGFSVEHESPIRHSRQEDSQEDAANAGGERTCMKKVEMEESVEYDEEERCHHVQRQNCFQIYKTVFKQEEVEECAEKFRKECLIEYEPVSQAKKVRVCDESVRRDCDATGGETVCSTEYQTVCQSEEKSLEVTDDTPECRMQTHEVCPDGDSSRCRQVKRQVCTTRQDQVRRAPVGEANRVECDAVPVEVCGPEICPITKGERICRDVVKHVIQEVPREECTVVPVQTCAKAVQIVPSLVEEEQCVDEPAEVCSTVRLNPRRVQRPVVRWWCSSPSTNDNTVTDEDANDANALLDAEGDENFAAAFQAPATASPSDQGDGGGGIMETEETFEFYSHFLMVNGRGLGSMVTLDADGQNCPLSDFGQDYEGRFGMLLSDSTTLRICGVMTGVSGLACSDYDQAAGAFASVAGYDNPAAGRTKAAVVEIAPGIYWLTGGILANDGQITDTSIILDGEGKADAGPTLPERLHSHCIVRVNATHFFLHGGTDSSSAVSARAYLFDARRRRFSPVDSSGPGYSGHVCGVVREERLRVLAVGGGEQQDQVSSFDVGEASWTELGAFSDGLSPTGTEKWQMEDTFMVIGVPSPDSGLRRLIYEFDTTKVSFVHVDETPLEVVHSDDGRNGNVVLPVPVGIADRCLENNAAAAAAIVRRNNKWRRFWRRK